MARLASDERYWTYADYCRLPADGSRYEIIEGRLYVNPAPSSPHQAILRRLVPLFDLLENAGQIYVYFAPIDLFLPGADPVQPDLLVLTADQRGLIRHNGIHGAPALIVEILSPATAGYDRTKKLRKYAESGVPFYWIVDVAERTLEILRFQADGRYLLDASIGVGETYTAPAPFTDVVVDLDALFRNVPALDDPD